MWIPCLEYLLTAVPSPSNLTTSAPSQALVTWSPDNYLLAHFGATFFPVSHDSSPSSPHIRILLVLEKPSQMCPPQQCFLWPSFPPPNHPGQSIQNTLLRAFSISGSPEQRALEPNLLGLEDRYVTTHSEILMNYYTF